MVNYTTTTLALVPEFVNCMQEN